MIADDRRWADHVDFIQLLASYQRGLRPMISHKACLRLSATHNQSVNCCTTIRLCVPRGWRSWRMEIHSTSNERIHSQWIYDDDYTILRFTTLSLVFLINKCDTVYRPTQWLVERQQSRSALIDWQGDAENAGLENSGPKCRGGKRRTGKRETT